MTCISISTQLFAFSISCKVVDGSPCTVVLLTVRQVHMHGNQVASVEPQNQKQSTHLMRVTSNKTS